MRSRQQRNLCNEPARQKKMHTNVSYDRMPLLHLNHRRKEHNACYASQQSLDVDSLPEEVSYKVRASYSLVTSKIGTLRPDLWPPPF
jgi:hypothetical protein